MKRRPHRLTAPNITIIVRHTAGCKYEGDEFNRRCNCRKSLRWYKDKKLHVKSAKTRSWSKAEEVKRDLEEQFEGRKPDVASTDKPISEAITVFLTEKTTEGLSEDTVNKYARLLRSKLQPFCEARTVFTVEGITRDLITEFCSGWPKQYPSTLTRSKLREKLRSFLRYCYEAQWLDRVPAITKVKVVEPETQPLTPEEYKRLLDVVFVTVGNGDPRRQTTKNGGGRWQHADAFKWQHAVYSFLQTMRWTGLSIGDTMRLRRDTLTLDKSKGLYRVTTKRKKTGVPVSNPIPPEVAQDLLQVENSNPEYFFWSGKGKVQSATSNWGQRYIAPCFKAAGIESEGNMLSHRLRDTFAVDLLEKGVPMEEVSKLLGHTSIRTTEKHYAKWSKGRQDRLDNLVSDTWVTPKKRNRPGRKPKLVLVKPKQREGAA
jgi:integrase/recombinase XerD